ncbi:MAG: hypothetical protein FWC12_00375 [Treponema sp.]|nr:hypothetical protein [Treponema sp.]
MFIWLITITILGMRPIQASIIKAVQQIKTDFIGKLEEFTGLEIRYSSLRPSFFGSIDIRNLKLLKDKEIFFSVNRISIKFSLREMVLRKKTFINTVLIDRPQIIIDTERDKDTLKKLADVLFSNESDLIEQLQILSQYLPMNVDYLIRQCNLSLKNNGTIFKIEDMNINLWRLNEKIFLNGKLGSQITFENLFNKTLLFKTNIGLDALYSSDNSDSKINIAFNDLICSEQIEEKKNNMLFSVLPENVSIVLKDRMIKIESDNKENKKNIDYFYSYDLEKDDYFANIDFNNFFIQDKIKFSNQLREASNLLQLHLTGSSFIGYVDKQMDYNVNLNGISKIFNQSNNDLIIKLNGNDKSIKIDDFSITSSGTNNSNTPVLFFGKIQAQGNMEFETVKPHGFLIFDQFSLTGKESLSAVFNVSSDEMEVKIKSDIIKIAKTQINDFNLLFFPADNDTGISLSAFLENEGVIYLDAVYENILRDTSKREGKSELEASLTFASVSLFEIAEISRPFVDYFNITPVNTTLQNTLFDAEIFFSTDFKNIVFNAPNILLDLNGSLGMLSVSGTDRQITISEGIFNLHEKEFNVSANMNYSNPMELFFSVNASYLDLSWNIEGQVFDKKTLIINDPNGLNLYGNIANNEISGFIEAADFPLLVKTRDDQTQIIYLNFFFNLRYNSMELWNLDFNRFTVRGQNASLGTEFLRISGNANQDGASFREIILSDLAGVIAGSADFSWDNDFSYIEFIFNATDGRAQGEYYDIEGIFKDEKINVRVSVNEMHINRYMNDITPMLLSAQAVISWDSINSFNIFADISSFNTSYQYIPVSASVKIKFNNDIFLVQDLNLKIAELQTVLPEFMFNRLEGSTNGQASVEGIFLEKSIEGNINLNVNISNTDSWFDLRNAFNTFNGTLRIDNLVYDKKNQDPFIFKFSGDKGAFSLSGGVRDMLRLEIDSEGVFFAGMSAPMPINCSISGTYKNGIIDAQANNFFIDLASIWAVFVSVPDFNISAGFITGSFDIRGPLTNPEFFGTARATSMRFQLPNYISEDLRLVPFAITAQGYEMTFGPFVTAIGSGNGIVKGWFLFDNWIPGIIGLDIIVPKENPVPYNFNIYGFLANGYASGNLLMTIDILSSMFELKGDLLTNNAVLGLNIDELAEERDIYADQEMYSALDLKITTGSAVEFVWPSSSPILRANPEMGTAIYISSDTQAGQYSLNSDVKIRSGELYYFDRSFYIRQGSLIFRESETHFDPRFTTRAEIRDRSETGPVTITMIVENKPLLSFEPRFEASPSLTQLEIYSILGQNMSSQGYESAEMAQRFLITSATDLLTQVAASSEIFAQLDFIRIFERQVRKFFGLDMFTVRTRFVQNIIATGATGGFAPTSENNRSNRFGNYFDNTTVFIGKYIGQNMFIQGMITMRYDENSDLLGGIRFEPDIGIELQSPFINIRWDFFPYHPENWYVNDNSITLSWSKSF